jgi:hypothetical protein
VQKCLIWFVTLPAALSGVPALFVLAHASAGPLALVLADTLLIVLDSRRYGRTFTRGRNVRAAWLARGLAVVC